jgi:hypothetical protein
VVVRSCPHGAGNRWHVFRFVAGHGFQNRVVLLVRENCRATALFVVNAAQLARWVVWYSTLRHTEIEEALHHAPALGRSVNFKAAAWRTTTVTVRVMGLAGVSMP